MTDAEKLEAAERDQAAIVALLRQCVEMDAFRCRNTLKEALKQMDIAAIERAR